MTGVRIRSGEGSRAINNLQAVVQEATEPGQGRPI